MSKKKFDKSNSVTFKLAFRDTDDYENSGKTLSERIFSVIEADKKKADKENDKVRQRILSQFTQEDLGQAPVKKAKNLLKDKIGHSDISSFSKGRDDLWITHLMRMKEQARAEVEEEDEEEEIAKAKQAPKKTVQKFKKKEIKEEVKGDEGVDEEGWESCDDEDEDEDVVVEEWEEEEEEEEYEEEEILTKKKEVLETEVIKKTEEPIEQLFKEKPKLLDDIVQSEAPKVEEDEFPTLGCEDPAILEKNEELKARERRLEELAEEEIDLRRVKIKGNAKTKRYDDLGLPIDGYNYYQHIAPSNTGVAPNYAFTAQYEQVIKLPEDVDIRREKMTAEEKEVFDALEIDDNKPAYDEIEDNFFDLLTKEEKIVVVETDAVSQKGVEDNKKVTFAGEKVMEISTMKDDVAKRDASQAAPGGKDSIYKKKDFQKVLNAHVGFLKEKYREERDLNKKKYKIEESSESEEVEEVDSFEDEEEDNKINVERVPFSQDYAAQKAALVSSDDENAPEEVEERDDTLTQNSKVPTQATSGPVAKKANLNIIKEQRSNTHHKTDKEGKKAEDGEKEEDGEEDDEDEDSQGAKVEEVFKKREKGETKEEKQQRKALIKQFKKDRKEKKQKFKETFETMKKDHIITAQKQNGKLQGLSIYKLTI